MKLIIIKYNAGNTQSVLFALERIGVQATVTDNWEEIAAADKVIFPGVGEASTAMAYLKQRKLDLLIKSLKQPVLGVCLGMQLMCNHSDENDTACLGIFQTGVRRFVAPPGDENQFKVPQMGWNKIYHLQSPLFAGLNDDYCYFVHSYFAPVGPNTIATTNYIQPYSAALQKDNFYGVQFHPEKSADAGQTILQNFINKV